MMKQYAALNDTLYFWFAANTTAGTGGDGASAAAKVRLAGAAGSAAPVYSATVTLLSDAGYPDGCYEVSIVATAANGFASGSKYGVFCTLAIDSQNPSGFIGSFDLAPVRSDIRQVVGSAVAGVDDFKADVTNLDAAVSSRLASASYTAPPSAEDLWAYASRTLTGGGDASAANQTTIIGLLENATYGLAALETLLDAAATDADLLVQLQKNKEYVEKVSSTWYRVIRNSGDTDDILRRALKKQDGTDIADPAAAAIAQQLASSV